MSLSLIVATDVNNGIGFDNTLPWHQPADMTWFKQHTTGKVVVMGRKTFESIGRPLPFRTNYVLSRDVELEIEGVTTVNDIDDILSLSTAYDVVILGGSEIYKEFLPHCEKAYITKIKAEYECDAFFPELDNTWVLISESDYKADELNKDDMTFQIYHRK